MRFFPVCFFQEFILFHWTRKPSFTQSLVAGSFMFISNNTPKRTLTDIKQNKHYLLGLAFWKSDLCIHRHITLRKLAQFTAGREEGGGWRRGRRKWQERRELCLGPWALWVIRGLSFKFWLRHSDLEPFLGVAGPGFLPPPALSQVIWELGKGLPEELFHPQLR